MSVGSETRCHGDDVADVDEVNRDAAEQALMVLLQHPSVMQQDHHIACKLLCTSKQLGELLAARCGGALELCCEPSTTEQADALGAWLSRHGGLLCSLELFSYSFNCSDDALVRLLACIPDGLTRLVVDLYYFDVNVVEQEATALLACVLSRQLARLRTLALPYWPGMGAAATARATRLLLPTVAALSGLTSLRLPMPEGRSWDDDDADTMGQVEYGRAWAQQLPAQLQELELIGGPECSSVAAEWLALERLTGLTRLRTPMTIIDGGVLPRSVRSLEVRMCEQGAPWLATLQGLPQLTQLVFRNEGIVTHELQLLSTLSRLRAVHLNVLADIDEAHAENACLHDASSSLGTFPLVSLHASNQALTPEVLSGLCRCTGLTHLAFPSACWLERATPEQLADCVVRLSALVTLSIEIDDDEGFCDAADGGEQRPGWLALAQVVGRLPVLRSCGFKGLPLGPAAALLGAATQLTKLGLVACGVDDSIVAGLCGSMTGLRALDLYNSGVSDACLPAIAAALLQLTYLRLSRVGRRRDGGVTDAGVQQLRAGLPGLKVARVEGGYEESESFLETLNPFLDGLDDE